ncbi:MAG: hypothetical protein ACE37F_27315 [Nannocystaceae bacterium]|nr:hypothetical protein [bacterium]
MVRVATLCIVSSVLACGGAAPQSSPGGETRKEKKTDTANEAAAGAGEAESKVVYPAIPPRGTLVLEGSSGAWADATFTGSPTQETFSRQTGTLYTQTKPKADGETPLTYTFKETITSLTPGEHRVREGFTVYGLGGNLDTYSFSGTVNVETLDAAAGVFAFAYVGSLALEGKQSAVQGAVNVQVPPGG